ncbi:hypothetical protein NAV33_15560, partial [Pseudomonas stutzeri]|uniref:hypothetical protein n=1 Tax=Stutzerimonas stutzeri TaxID=316 RepID=UPI00210A3F08
EHWLAAFLHTLGRKRSLIIGRVRPTVEARQHQYRVPPLRKYLNQSAAAAGLMAQHILVNLT